MVGSVLFIVVSSEGTGGGHIKRLWISLWTMWKNSVVYFCVGSGENKTSCKYLTSMRDNVILCVKYERESKGGAESLKTWGERQ